MEDIVGLTITRNGVICLISVMLAGVQGVRAEDQNDSVTIGKEGPATYVPVDQLDVRSLNRRLASSKLSIPGYIAETKRSQTKASLANPRSSVPSNTDLKDKEDGIVIPYSRPDVTINLKSVPEPVTPRKRTYYRFATNLDIGIRDTDRRLSTTELDAILQQVLPILPTAHLSGLTQINTGVNQVSPLVSWDLTANSITINLVPSYGDDCKLISRPLIEAVEAHYFVNASASFKDAYRQSAGGSMTDLELAQRFGQLAYGWVQDSKSQLVQAVESADAFPAITAKWLREVLMAVLAFSGRTGNADYYLPGAQAGKHTSVPVYRMDDMLRVGDYVIKLDAQNNAVGWAKIDASQGRIVFPKTFKAYAAPIALPKFMFGPQGIPLLS